MDGIDTALVDVDTHTCIAGVSYPYSRQTRGLLKHCSESSTLSLTDLCQLDVLIGREFAAAVNCLLEQHPQYRHQIKAIGSHGQTVCHDAKAAIPYTLQLGCAHTIAELTGITTVADFRTRDLVLKGQGAPFAPIYHQAICHSQMLPLALINIGGIANITYLQPNNHVSGYDIGPGNCLMDAWIFEQQQLAFDKNGDWAASGRVIVPLLDTLLADDFLQIQAPKSIGKEYFSLDWLKKAEIKGYLAQDIQATLLQLTIETIKCAVNNLPLLPRTVLIAGGGVHNRLLMQGLQQALPEVSVQSSASVNINPDFLEAMMFAWLAEKTITQTPLDMRNITGANKKAVYGVIYFAGD